IPTQSEPGVSGTTHFLGTFSLVYFRSPASKWTIKKCATHFPVHPPVPFNLNERYLTPYHVKGCGPTGAPLQIPTQSEPGVSGTTHFSGTFSLVYFRSPASKWTIKKFATHFIVHPPVPFTLNERYLTPIMSKGVGQPGHPSKFLRKVSPVCQGLLTFWVHFLSCTLGRRHQNGQSKNAPRISQSTHQSYLL